MKHSSTAVMNNILFPNCRAVVYKERENRKTIQSIDNVFTSLKQEEFDRHKWRCIHRTRFSPTCLKAKDDCIF